MKKQYGITLIVLLITIVVITIVTATIITTSSNALKVKKLNNMYSDIKILDDRVFAHFNKYGALPVIGAYTGTNTNFLQVKNPNDDNLYYVIDITYFNNLALTRNLIWVGDDVYIINNASHTIYYPKGVEYEDNIYYTVDKYISKDDEVDFVADQTQYVSSRTVADPNTQTYTITYNANGGTGTMSPTTGQVVNIASNTFTAPEGKVFKEWNTNQSGTGTAYIAGTSVNSNLTLYAIWEIPSVDSNGLATKQYTIVADATNNIQIVIPAGFAPAILNGSNSTTSNPGQDGSVKSVMPANEWSSITAAQINSGVVVKNAAGEEFVWVPIPSSSNFARTAWIQPQWDGEWQPTLAETSTTDAYWEDTSTIEYTNMVRSVNTNKGFYLSRYEASQGTNNIAQSKRGVLPWTGIPQNDSTATTDAIRASSANNIANTHLLYGIEWDSVLNWLIGHAIIGSSTSGQTKTMESSDIASSKSWGNYTNATGNAAANSGTKRSGAYNEYWKANNIYDLAGNVYEWTQEKYSKGVARVFRGGDCNYAGYFTSSSRSTNDETDTHRNGYGIRLPL